ncbi:hypothetical protein Lepto7375DRAFT_6643 [Leptolyngbya sp. PCC 7375]|nr:hypothetical protein Lepto7375DRAFT_6643 [Leptolyngbya sp. PCC 7375]
MQTQTLPRPKAPAGFISSSRLLLISFATVFFPRLLESMGAPAPINFVHFIVLPAACSLVMLSSRHQSRRQLATVQALLVGLVALFAIATASALLNNAGLINVFLGLMIISEPFIFLAALISVPFTQDSLDQFKNWILRFGAIHLGLAVLQKVGLTTGLLAHTRMTIEDNIQGVFYLSSGGHVVGASASLVFGLYYYVSAKTMPVWIRTSVLAAVMAQVLFADAKQVILVAFLAWGCLIFSKITDFKVAFQYIIAAGLLGYTFYWCIYNVDFFSAYRGWIRPHIYGPNGDATVLKTTPFRVIPNHYNSFLNWFFGLGPGHTIGRIGGWMIRDYWSLVGPMGATTHPVTDLVWSRWRGNYLDSSFFSPLWGWAGIWGDLGLLGLASYIYLWFVTLTRITKDDVSRFFVLNIIVNGFIFTLMEEPGFTLTSIVLVGLRWHELRIKGRG